MSTEEKNELEACLLNVEKLINKCFSLSEENTEILPMNTKSLGDYSEGVMDTLKALTPFLSLVEEDLNYQSLVGYVFL